MDGGNGVSEVGVGGGEALVHLNKFASIDDEERGKYIRRKRVSFVRFRPKPFFPHISVSQLSSPDRRTGIRTARGKERGDQRASDEHLLIARLGKLLSKINLLQ